MIIMRSDATTKQIEDVNHQIVSMGLTPHLSEGIERTVIGVVGIGEPRNHVGDHHGGGIVVLQDIVHDSKDRVIRWRRYGRFELEDLDFEVVSDDGLNLPQEVLLGLSR